MEAPALYVPRPKLAHLPEKHTLEVKDPAALTPGAFGDLADKPYRFALTYEKVTKAGSPPRHATWARLTHVSKGGLVSTSLQS